MTGAQDEVCHRDAVFLVHCDHVLVDRSINGVSQLAVRLDRHGALHDARSAQRELLTEVGPDTPRNLDLQAITLEGSHITLESLHITLEGSHIRLQG